MHFFPPCFTYLWMTPSFCVCLSIYSIPPLLPTVTSICLLWKDYAKRISVFLPLGILVSDFLMQLQFFVGPIWLSERIITKAFFLNSEMDFCQSIKVDCENDYSGVNIIFFDSFFLMSLLHLIIFWIWQPCTVQLIK